MTAKAADPVAPTFFDTAAAFRAWLPANHDKTPELWVGLRKIKSGLTSVTYKEAVDEALCFGWIDSAMKSIDAVSYRQRFTPRRRGSIWSAVNIARVEELTAKGLMHSAGLAAFAGRDPARADLYAFEQNDIQLGEPEQAAFRANVQAWTYFDSQPPSYRKQAIWWVLSAKREATRARRLGILIRDSEERRRLAYLTGPAATKGSR